MPTYQYRCTECGRDLEVVQKFSDASLTECPSCAGQLRKVFNAVGVVFKGSGFYRTDSRASTNGSDGNGSGSNGSGSSGADGNGSDKKADKPAEKTSEKTSEKSTGTESSKPAKVAAGTSGSSSSTGSKAASS